MPQVVDVVKTSMSDIWAARGLRKEDAERLMELVTIWRERWSRNRLRSDFYDMKVTPESIGIALSPEMERKIAAACGWPTKAVDMLAQRSIPDAFVLESGEESETLQRLLLDNRIAQKYPMAAVSELKHAGMAWTLSRGAVGRSKVRIKTHSYESSAMVWDGVEERIAYGMAVIDTGRHPETKAVQPSLVNLYTDEATVVLRRDEAGQWSAEYFPHRLGRPLMEPMCYSPTIDKPFGRSRITRSVMALTLSKLREDMRTELSAEFYTTPQRYLLGADEEAFDMNRYQAYIGNIFLASKDEDGDVPEFGQLSQGTMQPHTDYSRSLAAQFSGETGIPLHSLGIVSDNPDSAEAMQMAERDLVQLAEQMNRTNGESLRNVALMAMALSKSPVATLESLSEDEYSVMVKWHNPSMPNISATADAWQKLACAAEWIGETEEFLEGVGIDRATRRRMLNQKRRIQARSFMEVGIADTEGGDSGVFGNAAGEQGSGGSLRVSGVIQEDEPAGNGGIVAE